MKKLRDEARFESLEELTAAIAKDSAEARAFFGLTAPGAAEGAGGRDFATSATDRIS
ncbi:Riboflavin biosynthesis protein RibF [compost metagenome]